MADTNKKEYTSNLHPKGDMDTTVYPNVKSENIIDKDTTAYTAGKVPDSSLVQKSLDSLSENLETTKIQVSTNKTNIATLQGDVVGLKQDNETTKTTIAGLVSDNTQNKQDIATNSSDIALLESNAIKKDTDASLKSLTLPSASDLKTKDGTSFGGGSKVYNGTEYLPTFDIATLKDTYMDLQNNQTTTDECYKKISRVKIGYLGGYDRGFEINNYEVSLSYNIANKYTKMSLCSWTLNNLGGVNNTTLTLKNKYNYIKLSSDYGGNNHFGIKDRNDNVILSADEYTGIILYKGSELVTQATLATDLDAKQATLYRHTVLISEPTNKTAYLAFTAESDKNTPINSIQNLITVFGNTSIACSGLFRDGDPANGQSLLMINVGTSISNTTISSATIENNTITDFSNAPFTDTFGTTGFTITDNVTTM